MKREYYKITLKNNMEDSIDINSIDSYTLEEQEKYKIIKIRYDEPEYRINIPIIGTRFSDGKIHELISCIKYDDEEIKIKTMNDGEITYVENLYSLLNDVEKLQFITKLKNINKSTKKMIKKY